MVTRSLSAAAVLVLAGLCGAGSAQPEPAVPPVFAPGGSPLQGDAQSRLRPAVAQALERLTLIDLRMRDHARPDDFQIARLMLDRAFDLTPDDAELARRVAAAAFSSGDDDALVDATREVVRLDPADTVAQLRLINALIARRQTAEERLAAYDRFLGPSGERLDPSVRSRLALDAALLRRELGDDAGFRDNLALATALDITNKDAASVALRYFEDLAADDPVGLLELQIVLLHADPLDPHVHHNIAEALARQGAHRQARRMLGNTIAIVEQVTQVPNEFEIERLSLDAVWDSPRVVLDDLNLFKSLLVTQAERDLERAKEDGTPEEDWPDPGSVRLALEFERLRLVLATAVGDEETARSSMDDLRDTALEGVAIINEVLADPTIPPETRSQGITEYMTLFMSLQGARALTGMDIPILEAEVGEIGQTVPAVAAAARVLDPWVALHNDDPLGALDRARELDDPSATVLVRAAALEALDREDEAIELYLLAARDRPFEPSGVWAALRVVELAGESALLSDAGEVMAERTDRIPEWMDRMITQPSTFMELRVEATDTAFAADERAMVRIRLRNMAPIPLSVGADKVISSRLLISPALDTGVRGFVGTPQPEVLEFDRRLRLHPREAIEATVPADVGYTGYLIDLNARLTVRQRWRLMQSFQIGRHGAMIPGPMALSAETGGVERIALPQARFTPEEFTLSLERDDAVVLPRTLAGLRAHFMGPGSEGVPTYGPQIEGLVSALISRYDRGTPLERALMLATLPHGRQASPFGRFDDHARRTLTSSNVDQGGGVVAALVLLTRVFAAADPTVSVCEGSADPDTRRLAALYRERLERGEYIFALAGAHPNMLSGPTPGAPRRAEATTDASDAGTDP